MNDKSLNISMIHDERMKYLRSAWRAVAKAINKTPASAHLDIALENIRLAILAEHVDYEKHLEIEAEPVKGGK